MLSLKIGRICYEKEVKMRKNLSVISLFLALIIIASAWPQSAAAAPAKAPEKTAAVGKTIQWKAASGWPPGVFTRRMHDRFIAHVDKQSGGQLKISIVGPEAWPSAEQAAALAKGAFDIVFTTPGYYEPILPGGGFSNFAWGTMKEKRAAGVVALADRLHREKLNAKYLFEFSLGPYQMYLTKPVKKIEDFRGMRIRTVPSFHPMVGALGATPSWMPDAEAIDALRLGVIDGAQTAASQVTMLGYHEVTKYAVAPHPAFACSNAIVNLDSYNKLPDNLKKLLEKLALEFETEAEKLLKEELDTEYAKWKKAGLQIIVLPEEDGKKLTSTAKEVYLEKMVKPRAPNLVPEIRAVLDKLPFNPAKHLATK
jgi:TRAP-type C4-dicarboxylate transport system substrate-binding protein